MTASNPPPPTPLQIGDVSDTLQRFLESPSAAFEASADAKVRVRVNASMQLLAVEFLDSSVDGGCKRELELATVAAVNSALQKAALAAGDALNELARRFEAPTKRDDASAA
jgi:DNA-binding protein YbaB